MMTRMKDHTKNTSYSAGVPVVLDFGLIALIVSLAAACVYHPYFFGDELAPVYLSKHFPDFWSAFIEYSKYKPRFVFAAIWIFIAKFGAGRGCAAGAMVLAETVSACALFSMVRRPALAGSRLAAWLAVLAFISSRFGVMIWFDYIAGIIETLSFACFMCALLVLSSRDDELQWWQLAVAGTLFLAAVFVHERYAAPVFAFSLGLALFGRLRIRTRASLLLLSLAPIALFGLATALIGALPLTTGTNAQAVHIDAATFWAFLTYLSNVILQTNYGHDWFVGTLNAGTAAGLRVSVATAVIFCGFYVIALVFRRRRMGMHGLPVAIALGLLALIAIAALPGPARQEIRWMYPALGLLIVLGAILLRHRVFVAFVVAICCVNCLYSFSGSSALVYEVYASRIADEVGKIASSMPPGGAGLVIGPSEANWALGGGWDAGQADGLGSAFSAANLHDASNIRLADASVDERKVNYDFVAYFIGNSRENLPEFTLLSRAAGRLLLNPSSISGQIRDGERVIGGPEHWQEWYISNGLLRSGSLVLNPKAHAHYTVTANSANGKILVYTAQSLRAEPQPMRLQVNWEDDSGKMISSSIKVVSVTRDWRDYAAFFYAPAGARTAEIYATPHDGATDEIAIKRVAIADPMRMDRAPNE